MSHSSGSPNTRPAPFAPASTNAGRTSTGRLSQTLLLTLVTVAALIDVSVHATFAPADTPRAAGMGYLCDATTLIGCALALWTRARSAQGVLRIRWCFFTAAALAEGLGFLPSFTEGFLNTAPARQFQTACFNAGEALFILAVVLFFAGVARSVVLIDVLQTLVFIVLRFNLIYSPFTRDHFTHIHLIVGQSVALFLFLIATVACLGAASRAELTFLRTLSWFFGLRLIAFVTADQVSYIWLHHYNCSLWDVVGSSLFASFALYLVYTRNSAPAETSETAPLRRPSLAVRSLMPSFLALVNLMLGLFMLRISLPLAAVAISVTLVSYVVRTSLVHAQAAKEKAQLETRNEHLEGLAIRDPLTGIGNRRSLAGVYSQIQTSAGGKHLSLLLMDIDSFKKANDCHGHLFGDQVLVALARKLENLASGIPGSHSARLGGDEFALLLPDVALEEASTLAESLRASLNAHRFKVENGSGEDSSSKVEIRRTEPSRVSLSIGVASLEAARDLPLETLVQQADEALYRAKLKGRNRVELQQTTDPAINPEDTVTPTLHFELQHTSG
ncbi:MAG: GGDEF domain-containing protein [Acidobacteriaceae bacterium]